MPDLKSKQQLADAAEMLTTSFELVQHGTGTYIPEDWETGSSDPLPDPERRVWRLLTYEDKILLARRQANILFANDSEIRNFELMLKQLSIRHDEQPSEVLIRTQHGLRVLGEDGTLQETDGSFVPNTLGPVLNESEDAKKRVFDVIAGWLDSEEEAHSLLHHLATSLAPGWAAVKYVLLLGEGRNGKSVLLSMLTDLFGAENVSNVTRQKMSAQDPTCIDLNGKLLNVVFDGPMDYIRDSGMEKTLIAGEPGYVRRLYESNLTKVQTNGLFVEALNGEPKTRDKSSALQKRLVRYQFPNIYELDKGFERSMRRPQVLGAFLALLIDHYVKPDETDKLKPTAGSRDLMLDQMLYNSMPLQYLQHLTTTNPAQVKNLVGMDVQVVVSSFLPWLQSQPKGSDYSEMDALRMLRECFQLKRTRRRTAPFNYYKIAGLTDAAEGLLERPDDTTDEEDQADELLVDE